MTETQAQCMQIHNKACKFQQNNNTNSHHSYVTFNVMKILSTTNQLVENTKIIRKLKCFDYGNLH